MLLATTVYFWKSNSLRSLKLVCYVTCYWSPSDGLWEVGNFSPSSLHVGLHVEWKGETSTVIVISPLNALIEDQVNSLKERGIKAGVLHTSHTEKTNAANSQNDDSQSEDENEVSVV